MVSFVRHLTWALSSSSACWKNKKPATVVLQLHAQRSRSTFSAISAAVAAKKARAELSASSMPKSDEESSKEVQLISICAKCSDCCVTQAIDSEGEVIAEKDGYVPDFMPGNQDGDYIDLSIDVQTGKILNWSVPDSAKILSDLNS